MIKKIINKYKTRNYFDPSLQNNIKEEELKKILRGHVQNSESRDSIYFVICKNGISQLDTEKNIRIDDLENAIDNVLNKSEWFGKFVIGKQSQIIIPEKYELLIKPTEKQILLSPTERARYYGSGNLQLDKDLFTKVISTEIGFKEFKNIVNKTCSSYVAPFLGKTLHKWN